LKDKHGLTVLAQYVFYKGDNVSQNALSIGEICSIYRGQQICSIYRGEQDVCVLIVWSCDPQWLVTFQCFPVSAHF